MYKFAIWHAEHYLTQDPATRGPNNFKLGNEKNPNFEIFESKNREIDKTLIAQGSEVKSSKSLFTTQTTNSG